MCSPVLTVVRCPERVRLASRSWLCLDEYLHFLECIRQEKETSGTLEDANGLVQMLVVDAMRLVPDDNAHDVIRPIGEGFHREWLPRRMDAGPPPNF